MPKLKERPPSPARNLWALIEMQCDRKRMSRATLSEKTLVPISTIRDDANKPDGIRIDRLERYCKALGLPFNRIVAGLLDEIMKEVQS
jgi:DNA-binding Xre family transcriptional regulator